MSCTNNSFSSTLIKHMIRMPNPTCNLMIITFISAFHLHQSAYASSNQPSDANARCLPSKIYVSRHAAKQQTKGLKDPGLSQEGQKQAESLASFLQQEPIAAAFTTNYQRTQQTLAPLAKAKGIKPQIYNDHIGLVKEGLNAFCNKQVVIVGHSNTVPEVLQALGLTIQTTIDGQPLLHPPMVFLGEDDYGTVFTVTWTKHQPKLSIHRLSPPVPVP